MVTKSEKRLLKLNDELKALTEEVKKQTALVDEIHALASSLPSSQPLDQRMTTAESAILQGRKAVPREGGGFWKNFKAGIKASEQAATLKGAQLNDDMKAKLAEFLAAQEKAKS